MDLPGKEVAVRPEGLGPGQLNPGHLPAINIGVNGKCLTIHLGCYHVKLEANEHKYRSLKAISSSNNMNNGFVFFGLLSKKPSEAGAAIVLATHKLSRYIIDYIACLVELFRA